MAQPSLHVFLVFLTSSQHLKAFVLPYSMIFSFPNGAPAAMSMSALHRRQYQNDTEEVEKQKHLPTPSHRHAEPSAPWPWINIHDEIDANQLECEKPPVPAPCDHRTCGGCWKDYPQSRFPNWTASQIDRSKISHAIDNYNRDSPCRIYHVDVNNQGLFTSPGMVEAKVDREAESWDEMNGATRPKDLRVRALFLENLSGPILQMLGAKFDIEPFFWSSSLNWIPSRYQENPLPGKGDHITITLTFLKSLNEKEYSSIVPGDRPNLNKQMIDTRTPLRLRYKQRILVLDLLSVHLIRDTQDSTIISYHPNMPHHPVTEANYLRDRIRYAGQSVYWQMIFQKSPDPTFVLLTFIWHALYAWDEALQDLYDHVCWLETQVISTNDMLLTHELHVIRAHHLHYSSLIEDLRKTVKFIKKTSNPVMDSVSKDEREFSENLLKRECNTLLEEIDRLESARMMQDRRLKNVMNLLFSTVNIQDSKHMRRMAEAAVKDSAAVRETRYTLLLNPKYRIFRQMKQVAYLTMIFLPSSFVAAVFGMNIKNFVHDTSGTLAQYFEVAVPLTVVTIWVLVAFQSKHMYPEGTSLITRFGWPVKLLRTLFGNRVEMTPLLPMTTRDAPHSR